MTNADDHAKSLPGDGGDGRHLRRVARLISTGKAQNIIVLTGAGISTSAGIPDFRSPTTGLYANLQSLNLPFPEAVFELGYFKRNPKPFWILAKELYPGKHLPTPTHHFLKLLHRHQSLLRIFSQNIDTLDTLAQVPTEKIVEAHGSFATSHCLSCGLEVGNDVVLSSRVREGKVVYCPHSGQHTSKRTGDDQGGGDACGGLVKPDIVFFGEGLPERFFDRLGDFRKCDLLIVIGTSLQVQPFASLVDRVGRDVPRLLINKESAGPFRYRSPPVGASTSRSGAGGGTGHRRESDRNHARTEEEDEDEDEEEEEEVEEASEEEDDDEEGDENQSESERDMFHQGDADGAIWTLAEMLGWKDELESTIIEVNKHLEELWGLGSKPESEPETDKTADGPVKVETERVDPKETSRAVNLESEVQVSSGTNEQPNAAKEGHDVEIGEELKDLEKGLGNVKIG